MSNQSEIDKLCAFHPEASQGLADMLFGDDLAKRAKWFKLFENPLFHENRSFKELYDLREIAYRRIEEVA